MMKLWDRQPNETAAAFAAFCLYRDIPQGERSIVAAAGKHRKSGGRASARNWEVWSSRYDWVNRAAEHDSELASRRRERRARELERAQDDIAAMARTALERIEERLERMDAEEIAPGQLPAWFKVASEIELKALGYEDHISLTGKDGGPLQVESNQAMPLPITIMPYKRVEEENTAD